MARTAPVPNIPAIPGMNPGVFVMGGGGSGGGGRGRGGSGNAAGQGSSGKNGGNGADGGGRGANGCGPGSGGGCMNPVHGGNGGTHAGDPVDPATGRVYTLPQTDLVLTGPMVFELRRSYSSFARERDVGLGAGWTHSLAWEIELRRRTLVVHSPSGVAPQRDIPPVGGEATLHGGSRLRRDEGGFLVTGEDGLVYLFEPFAASRERHRLAAVVDRAGNRIDLAYQGDWLEALRDSAGRTVRVRRYPDGHIEAFELVTARGRTVRCRTYAYDDRGDLISATDAAGRSVRYRYDDHRLVEQISASGLRVAYRYDEQGRCTETWCAHPGAHDPALAKGSPTVLADGQTPARGMLHCRLEYADGFTLVYDSRQARRFDTNAFGKIDLAAGVWVEGASYDASGELVAYSDPTGARTLYERDAAGRIVAIVDPAGARIQYRYDPQGNVVEAVDAHGVACHYAYDGAANLLGVRDALGELLRFTYDDRGLRVSAALPDGGVTLFRHDAEGNLVELVEPHGKPRRMEYDDVGRVLAVTDEEGHRTSFHYDERGALWGLRFPGGAEVTLERDEDGRITRYRGPDGGAYELVWGGYNLVHELRKPNGEIIRFRYDRECQLVEVRNDRGEVHRIERDAAGRVVAERFFDGRERRYRLDAAGRLQHIRSAAGEATEIERDPCGRVVRRSYADDTFDAFAYDPVGRLVHAETEATVCEFTYDDRGNLVRETQTCAGRTVVIESAYDAAGRRTALRTTTGLEVRYERDPMGRARRVVAPGTAIGRTYDAFGRELLRELPGGGRVLCRYDGIGALVERRVLGRAAARGPEPDWVGPLPPGTTYAEGFAHSPGGELVEHVVAGGERTRFEHDPTGRILARTSTHAPAERFAHGGGGCLLEVGDGAPARQYGPGGVLLARGEVTYEHDAEARRTARIDAATGARVRYRWSDRGLLTAVVLPDGTRVENTYDTSARRLLKRVCRADGAVIETRFVWSGDDVLQEITEEVVGAERRAARVRDYLWDEQGEGPLAHREQSPGGEAEGRWVHYVLGAGGVPSLLLSDAGEVLARLRLSVWGALDVPPGAQAPTPWRYPGQYHDDETGLAYNRYRFYDAAVGLYLSPDPLGIAGGLNAFEYARGQPFRVADPEGLTPVQCTVSGRGVRGRGTSASGRTSDPELHPVVAAALPPPVDLRGEPFYPAERRSPEACAEPGALSQYIRNWERQNNNGRPLDPNNPRDRRKIQRCLRDITSIQAQHPDGTARAPCPNCSQLLQNLRDRWGAPRERVVQPGASSETGTDSLRSTPPDPRWAQAMRQQRRQERRRR